MKFPFIKKRLYWYILSSIFSIIAITSLFMWQLRPGIDFTGGSLLEVQFSHTAPTIAELQNVLPNDVYGPVNIQPSDNNVMLFRLKELSEDTHQSMLNTIANSYAKMIPDGSITQLRFESIGPSIGIELQRKAITTTVLTLIMIIAYIAYSFRKVSQPVASWKYGIAALIALFHDILFLLGVFSILGHFLHYEINILFITALLTTLGYSVNDTIVVFDRIRENLYKKHESFSEAVEDSMNQTFARSVNTSFTTLLTLFAVYFFGGDSIKEFALALLVGIGIGTYSSIFVASPILVDWHLFSLRKNK